MDDWKNWSADRDETPRFLRTPRAELGVWQIVLGVAGGILLAGAIGFAFRVWLVHQAASALQQQAEHSLRRLNEQNARMAEKVRLDQAEVAERARVREEARRTALAEAQRAQDNARRQALAEAERKERAWGAFYQRPAHCDNPPDGNALVACANEHIRARKRFESTYKW
jgi:hypothetical protein